MNSIWHTIISVILISTALLSQTHDMKIHQGTAQTHSAINTVDSITFQSTSSFVCGDVILYGGETYQTVLIGSQCWFQKNLNIGTSIAGVSNQTDNSIIEKYCYSDLEQNCTTHGGLYQWDEAMQYVTTEGAQGICPTGWHIPTLTELTTLKSSVSSSGNALKAVGQGSGAGAGTNTRGFSALLAGERDIESNFLTMGDVANTWSSTEDVATSNPRPSAFILYLTKHNSTITHNDWPMTAGISVRCLKD